MTIDELKARLQAPSGPVLDVHVHPFSGFGPHRAESPEEDARILLEAADRAGVTHLVLFCLQGGYQPTPEQFRAANDACLRAADVAPDRLLPFCYVSGEYRRASLKEIERCVGTHRFVGVKLWIAAKASDPAVADLAAAAAAHGAPVLQHAWDKTDGNYENESTPADVAKLARMVPDAKIIMAHLNGHGMRGIERVQACTNIHVDTSGGDPETGMVELACRRLGYQRVLFGSDAPIRHYGVQMSKVLGAAIPDDQKRAVLWDNAVRLLPAWAKLEGALVA